MSVQMDLFSSFLSNDSSKVSNTVEIWESIPKYFFTTRQVEKLRSADGSAKPYKWPFTYQDKPCTVRIQPAYIDDADGVARAYFPSVTEELVEEALKKILTMQSMGLHDLERTQTWVRFTLRMLQKELKERGKSRSIKEIKQAIEIMNRCVLSVYIGKKEVWSGAILQDLVTVDREEYLADTEAHHVARLPLFITNAINQLEYRQYNYDRLMSCKEQLTRWIYKRLINRFRQASMFTEYHFMYTDLQNSGLLQQIDARRNRRKIRSSLEELKTHNVLISWCEDVVKDSRKIIDAKYTLIAHQEFITEQKAANKRQKDNQSKAKQHRIPNSVDNFL